ncbi:hypothetical protein [Faecalispora jeddahensis]|uniref:hypothetical protein n=1 Tax=Faecalispora jeddahensis TaxID=1414721 RepID=UPI00145B04C1|nr:hypothetical protein [Faecalispora jeddahensis]
MIDPGELNEQIEILEVHLNDTEYAWAKVATAWAKAETAKTRDRKNLFSSVGIGAKSITFMIWKQNLTLHNAVRWRGKFCFLTSIDDADCSFYEVTTALIEPIICAVTHITTTKNELKNPVAVKSETITFPAVLTEKYLGFEQREPQAVTETTYVLVTPKVIELSISDLVDVAGKKYCVQVAHTLDEYKNEYEVYRKGEPDAKH